MTKEELTRRSGLNSEGAENKPILMQMLEKLLAGGSNQAAPSGAAAPLVQSSAELASKKIEPIERPVSSNSQQ